MIRQSHMAALLVLILILAVPARGDRWGPPEPEHQSANGQYVLKVTWDLRQPGRLVLYCRTDTGLQEVWSRGYVDERWPPHMAYVSDDGQHVVLRDVYHNLGYKQCLVFLGPQGKVIRAYELRDFLTDYEILHTRMTESSRWWSEQVGLRSATTIISSLL